jgi:hypothetical protein
MHPELDESNNYGLGWRIIHYGRNEIVYHAGWWKGFRTIFVRDLKRGLTAIVLTNIRRGPYVGAWDLLYMFYGPEEEETVI